MKNNNLYTKALNYSLRLLLRRNYTQAEIIKKIKDMGYEEAICDEVTTQLKAWGYLDDKKYTESYIKSKINTGKGRRKIYFDLLKKGISKEIIDNLIGNDFIEENEYNKMHEVATKKAASLLKRYPSDIVKGKLFRFLISRGFLPNHVKSWLNANFPSYS